FGRRLLLAAAIGLLVAGVQAASALAGPGMIVGADEDTFVWGNSQQAASDARMLGLKAVRITRQWHPGESKVPADFQDTIYRIVGDVSGLRLVVSLYGRPEDAPRTEEARREFCSYVADLIEVNPQITDVVIWNDADGSSAAPADYEALLAACWDAAHAVQATANVVAATATKASAIPGGFTIG